MQQFVSFLYPFIDRGQGPLFRWLMLMQMDRLEPDAVCFIGDAATFAEEGLPFGEECEVAGFVFKAPTRERYREYRKYKANRDAFDRLLATSRGMLDCFRRMLTEDIPELRAQFDALLVKILQKGGVAAVLMWANCPALSIAAKARGIPVIHNELGPLRAPNFVPSLYFDFGGVNGATTAQRAASRHIDERKQTSLAALESNVAELYLGDSGDFAEAREFEFDAAVALQVEDDSNVVAFSNGWSTVELLRHVAGRHGAARTVVRTHPGSAFRLTGETYGRIDRSKDSLEFLRLAETLYTINSSVASEAAFLRRKFQVFGENPVTMLSQSSRAAGGMRARDARRAFYFLAYLVPARLAFDRDYYHWRLTRPSWEEIAERHLDAIRVERAHRLEEDRVVASVRQQQEHLDRPRAAGSSDWLAGRSLSVQLKVLDTHAKWLSEQREAWERLAHEQQARLAGLEQQLPGLQAERDRLALDRERLGHECDRLADALRSARENVDRLARSLQESSAANAKAAEARSWLEGERDRWQAVAEEANRQYAEVGRQLEEAIAARDWLSGQRTAWETQAQANAEAIVQWEKEGERLREAARWAEGQRAAWEREAAELGRQLADRCARIEKLDAEAGALRQKVDSLSEQLQVLLARIAELEDLRAVQAQQLRDVERHFASAAESIERLERTRRTMEARLSERDGLIATLSEARQRDEAQLASLQAQVREREAQHASALREIETLAASVQSLGAARSALQESIGRYQDRVGALEAELGSALSGLRRRRHELAALKTDPLVRVTFAARRRRSGIRKKPEDKSR